MRIGHFNNFFGNDTLIPNEWVDNYDVIVLSNFDPKLAMVLDSQVRRRPTLAHLFPELKKINFHTHLVIFGKAFTENLVSTLNPKYQVEWVHQGRMSPENYAQSIQKLNIPVCLKGYTYFHDMYFHALGVQHIPKCFTSWWQEHSSNLSREELVMMASVVEWTSLKEVSFIMEDFFSPQKWHLLDLFFKDEDRTWCNRETLVKVYKKYRPLMDQIISEWRKSVKIGSYQKKNWSTKTLF